MHKMTYIFFQITSWCVVEYETTRFPRITKTMYFNEGVLPSQSTVSIHVYLSLSKHLNITYFLWAALSPLWILKLSTSTSQGIVCLNWKVGRGIQLIWRTTSKPLFIFVISLHHFHSPCSVKKALSSEMEKACERERWWRKKPEIEIAMDDYMWAGLKDFSPPDYSLLIIRQNSLPPSMVAMPMEIFLTKRRRELRGFPPFYSEITGAFSEVTALSYE